MAILKIHVLNASSPQPRLKVTLAGGILKRMELEAGDRVALNDNAHGNINISKTHVNERGVGHKLMAHADGSLWFTVTIRKGLAVPPADRMFEARSTIRQRGVIEMIPPAEVPAPYFVKLRTRNRGAPPATGPGKDGIFGRYSNLSVPDAPESECERLKREWLDRNGGPTPCPPAYAYGIGDAPWMSEGSAE